MSAQTPGTLLDSCYPLHGASDTDPSARLVTGQPRRHRKREGISDDYSRPQRARWALGGGLAQASRHHPFIP
eukprot:COSAG02_NODE_34843_length_477_cov_1.214286_1_plen_71_part_10